MSRSKQHSPFIGVTTARSEKEDKQRWNRTYRKEANRSDDPVQQVRKGDRDGSKDGKRRITNTVEAAKLMRK